ncbi:MAG: PIN domain-containing protein [Nonlabens sp.]
MKFLLDTNICVHYLRGNFGLIDILDAQKKSISALSELTAAELLYVAEYGREPEASKRLVQDFLSEFIIIKIGLAIPIYAREKARLRRAGLKISDFDLLIGCTAIQNDLIMVTENLKDFKRISDLTIENWVDRN